MQKLVKTDKTQKLTNNSMSSFGLIEENVELSHIHLAVATICFKDCLVTLLFSNWI
jgi:hypothetical protein